MPNNDVEPDKPSMAVEPILDENATKGIISFKRC